MGIKVSENSKNYGTEGGGRRLQKDIPLENKKERRKKTPRTKHNDRHEEKTRRGAARSANMEINNLKGCPEVVTALANVTSAGVRKGGKN